MIVPAIGTRLRLEGRLFDRDLETKTAHHVVEHVIVQISHPARTDLQGHVAVPEVICRAGQ
jgi:hypothetical protein